MYFFPSIICSCTLRLLLHPHSLQGEGNGNPLQCSCLENPRDWGAWWAAVHGVAQSRTRLKRLSSSSSIVDLGVRSDLAVKNPLANAHRHKRHRFNPRVGTIPWRRAWQSTPVILPGESHGQRSLVGYSPWGRTESDMTVRISTAQHNTLVKAK